MFQNNFWLNNPDHGVFLADLDCGGIVAELWRNYNIYKAQQFPAKDTKKGLNERQIEAVDYVVKKGSISNKEYQEINNVARTTATSDLTDLVEKNIFSPSGTGERILRYELRLCKNYAKG
ncbi:MAG TPA: hypothetical protein ENI51_06155 [Candidatus Atribacteria bacterium]|nr:hypothetical protein [Candidatus Atribacteria bacterium]